MIPILQQESELLRRKAAPIPVAEISSKKIQTLIAKMKQALNEQEDGVAIAAPQIGESFRIFVVSGKIFTPGYPEIKSGQKIESDLVCINPTLTKLSKQKKKVPEGCLSVRWLYGDVLRSGKATISAHDERGKKINRGASGLLAQIFQHEVDHLDGILFIDKAENLEEIPPDEEVKKA